MVSRYNLSAYKDQDPPIPGNPCKYDKELVVPGSDSGFFNATTGNAISEEQMAAFIHHNGPVSAGINANVFGLREKGCEKTGEFTGNLPLPVISGPIFDRVRMMACECRRLLHHEGELRRSEDQGEAD